MKIIADFRTNKQINLSLLSTVYGGKTVTTEKDWADDYGCHYHTEDSYVDSNKNGVHDCDEDMTAVTTVRCDNDCGPAV